MADDLDPIRARYADPRRQFDDPAMELQERYQLLPLPPLPAKPQAEARNYTPPGPPRVQSEVAENISPTMGAYGTGSLITQAVMDARRGKYDPETLVPLGAIFAGPRAKTANLPILERAKAMAAEGADRKAIWDAQMSVPEPPRVANPIKAYHGSPHDFDQFSMKHIGTGEGAQAFGHGLYFAEAPGVAESYKIANTQNRVTFNGKTLPELSSLERDAADYAASYGGKERGLEVLDRKIASNSKFDDIDWLKKVRASLADAQLDIPKGKMYEVALHATPDSFLDWDKPLKDQLGVVGRHPALQAYYDKQAPFVDRGQTMAGGKLHVEGRHAMENLGARLGKEGVAPALAEAGIPGIRYLDQGSRGAGQGTSNFVVWNPEIIEILRKYGIAGATIPLAGTVLADPEPDKP